MGGFISKEPPTARAVHGLGLDFIPGVPSKPSNAEERWDREGKNSMAQESGTGEFPEWNRRISRKTMPMLCSGMLNNQRSRIKGSRTSSELNLGLAEIWILLEQLPPKDQLHTSFSQHPFPGAQPQPPSILQPNEPLGSSPRGKELILCRTEVPPVKAEP